MNSKTIPDAKHDFVQIGNDGRGLVLLISAGVLYVGASLFRDWFLNHVFPVPTMGHTLDASSDLYRQLASLGLKLPALFVIALEWVRHDSLTRRSFNGSRAGIVASLIVTVVLSLILNAIALWPFTWRWTNNGIAIYAVTLVRDSHWFTLVTWGVAGVLVVPFVEEIIFRIGILRLATRLTGRPAVGVMISASLFAAGHLGNVVHPTTSSLVNSAWLFVASIVIGHLTVKNDGRIQIALTVHFARNALEFLTLVGTVLVQT